jgi:hypothetical protein
MLPYASISPRYPGSIRVFESISETTAGPKTFFPFCI